MSEKSKRPWRFYVEDMVRFSRKVLEYTQGLTQKAFEANSLVRDATLRNLELIGEAATRIPESVRAKHPEVPWRQIVATRNQLIHGYLGLDEVTLWSLVEKEVPNLLPLLVNLLAMTPEDA
jgi:uncharacterized protein with HEPN domain